MSGLDARCPDTDSLFLYRARITRVVDGDTVVADIDLGCKTWLHKEHLRLYGIDTPEIRGVKDKGPGLAAKEAVEGMVEECGGEVLIRTHQDDRGKFGRYLVEIWDGREGMQGSPSFNAQLLSLGHAKEYLK